MRRLMRFRSRIMSRRTIFPKTIGIKQLDLNIRVLRQCQKMPSVDLALLSSISRRIMTPRSAARISACRPVRQPCRCPRWYYCKSSVSSRPSSIRRRRVRQSLQRFKQHQITCQRQGAVPVGLESICASVVWVVSTCKVVLRNGFCVCLGRLTLTCYGDHNTAINRKHTFYCK